LARSSRLGILEFYGYLILFLLILSVCHFDSTIIACFIPLGRRSYSTKNEINPVIVYSNSDTQKLDILKDNKGKSGIYLWKNEINEKLYVGSAQDLTRRLNQYYSIYHLTKDSGMLINKALLKYGYSALRAVYIF